MVDNLNYIKDLGFRSRKALESGSPETFGRSLLPKPRFERPVLLLSMSGSSATVNGRPLWNVATPCRSRFESHEVSQPLLASSGWPSPNGTWHEKLTEKRCRMSNAERPRSAAGQAVIRLADRRGAAPATMNRYFDGEVSHRADS